MAQATTLLQQFHFVARGDDGHRYVVDGMRTKSAQAWYVAASRDDDQQCAFNVAGEGVPRKQFVLQVAQAHFQE